MRQMGAQGSAFKTLPVLHLYPLDDGMFSIKKCLIQLRRFLQSESQLLVVFLFLQFLSFHGPKENSPYIMQMTLLCELVVYFDCM